MSQASPPSTRPYLIRAIYEWSLDNGFTPQILVSTTNENVSVPAEHVQDGQIVLNIHPQSVKNLELGNEYIMCSARFSGRPFELIIPIVSVLAVYSRENGQGIVFQDEGSEPPSPPSPETGPDIKADVPPGPDRSSHLKLVK